MSVGLRPVRVQALVLFSHTVTLAYEKVRETTRETYLKVGYPINISNPSASFQCYMKTCACAFMTLDSVGRETRTISLPN